MRWATPSPLPPRLTTAGGWAATLPPGWERTSDTVAVYTVTFADVSCTPVAPISPTVVAATCVAGDLTPPTVTLAVTPGVTFVADRPGPYDPTVEVQIVVTATLADGYAWDTGPSTLRRAGVRGAALPQQAIPAGWAIVDPGTATFAVTIPASPPCPEMTPVAPTVTEPQCIGGVLTAPMIVLAATEGLTYVAEPSGLYAPGDTVTVTGDNHRSGSRLGGSVARRLGWCEPDHGHVRGEVRRHPVRRPADSAPGAAGDPLTISTPIWSLMVLDSRTVSDGSPLEPSVIAPVAAELASSRYWAVVTDPWVEPRGLVRRRHSCLP